MNFPKFLLYTFLGSFPWSFLLAWAGWNWPPRAVREALRPFDIPIALIILALIAWFIVRSVRNRRQPAEAAPGPKSSRGAVPARRNTASPEVRVVVKPAVPAGAAKRRSSRGYVPPSKNGRNPPAAS